MKDLQFWLGLNKNVSLDSELREFGCGCHDNTHVAGTISVAATDDSVWKVAEHYGRQGCFQANIFQMESL